MTLLDAQSRPTVYFDTDDREHRHHYMRFLQNRSWRQCPVQFYLEKGYGDLASMIENKLARYYLQRDFRQDIPDRTEQWATS